MHKSSRVTARGSHQASGAGGGDATERIHSGSFTSKPFSSRGFSATVGAKGKYTGAGPHHSQSMQTLLMTRIGGDAGGLSKLPKIDTVQIQ